MKNSVLDNFPPCPPAHAPLKSANLIFIVVSLSLIQEGGFQIVERAAFSSRGNLLLQGNST